jgi:hypothetical protein
MKIAILLRGIALNKSYFSHRKVKRLIDYHLTYLSLNTNLVENNQVDFYLHTWKTPDLDINEFLDLYNPIAYQIDEPVAEQNNHRRTAYYSCNQSILRVLQLFLDKCSDIEYDHIILARYDLMYLKKLSSYSLTPKNPYLMTSSHSTFEDNFCILTKELIPEYIKKVKAYMFFSHHKTIEKMLPFIHNFILGSQDVKYLNEFYNIHWIQF